MLCAMSGSGVPDCLTAVPTHRFGGLIPPSVAQCYTLHVMLHSSMLKMLKRNTTAFDNLVSSQALRVVLTRGLET